MNETKTGTPDAIEPPPPEVTDEQHAEIGVAPEEKARLGEGHAEAKQEADMVKAEDAKKQADDPPGRTDLSQSDTKPPPKAANTKRVRGPRARRVSLLVFLALALLLLLARLSQLAACGDVFASCSGGKSEWPGALCCLAVPQNDAAQEIDGYAQSSTDWFGEGARLGVVSFIATLITLLSLLGVRLGSQAKRALVSDCDGIRSLILVEPLSEANDAFNGFDAEAPALSAEVGAAAKLRKARFTAYKSTKASLDELRDAARAKPATPNEWEVCELRAAYYARELERLEEEDAAIVARLRALIEPDIGWGRWSVGFILCVVSLVAASAVWLPTEKDAIAWVALVGSSASIAAYTLLGRMTAPEKEYIDDLELTRKAVTEIEAKGSRPDPKTS